MAPAVFLLSSLLEDTTQVGIFGYELGQEFAFPAIVTISALLVSVFVFLIFLSYVRKNIVAQIRKVQIATSYVLRGKTNYKIELEGSDELEQLAKSFDLLKTSLRKNAELEQELGRSKTELEQERLVTIGLIASRLAHDIRNPLNVIKNTVEIMKLKFKDHLDEATENQFARLANSISRISHQIEDVLDYVRESPLQIKPVSLADLIDGIVHSIKKPEGIKIIKPDCNVVLECDQKKMEVVFTNLFVNAIQAVGESGQILVRATEQQNHIIIDVEDSGPGIPRDVLDKIFEPLFTTKQTGTGLGLPSCKNIIEQHHGKIVAANNPTRFTIKLPKKQAQNPSV
jgi:signal transduction histidine kinase